MQDPNYSIFPLWSLLQFARWATIDVSTARTEIRYQRLLTVEVDGQFFVRFEDAMAWAGKRHRLDKKHQTSAPIEVTQP